MAGKLRRAEGERGGVDFPFNFLRGGTSFSSHFVATIFFSISAKFFPLVIGSVVQTEVGLFSHQKLASSARRHVVDEGRARKDCAKSSISQPKCEPDHSTNPQKPATAS